MALKIILSVLFGLLILGIVLVVIADDGDPGRKLAWLLVITFIPVLGIILYLLFGINLRHHWIFDRKHARFRSLFEKEASPRLLQILYGTDTLSEVKEYYRQFSTMLGTMPSCAVTDGNDFELITEGSRKFELLMADLAAAKHSIHMEYFHFGNDKGSKAIREMLMEKASEGVEVRFIHENIANFPIPGRYYAKMRKAGVEVIRFTNPRSHILALTTMLNYRNHRKIVVIDGKIGYTGGMNINDNYFHRWRDTHMRITGPAVASLQYIFMDSWITGGGTLRRPLMEYFEPSLEPFRGEGHGTLMQVVPDEPDSEWGLIRMSYEWAITHARKYIWMQTPYFVPPESIMSALQAAALSGVDVRLMIPRKADNIFMGPANKAFFSKCLDAGVRVFLRNGNFMHCKTFVSDDYLSSVGTANMDNRSFSINYEVNTYIYDSPAAERAKQVFENDLRQCEEIGAASWAERPWYEKAMEYIIRLFAPLL